MRLIENIERIVIENNSFWLVDKENLTLEEIAAKSGEKTIFKRGDWNLFVEDIKQIQDQANKKTSILFDKTVDCEVDEDRKRIFCGKNPAKMTYL